MADDLKRMTLVERLKKADYVSRELSEHLRQASLPKLTGLIRACREYDVTAVSDQQILDRIHAVFEADEFADKLLCSSAHFWTVFVKTSSQCCFRTLLLHYFSVPLKRTFSLELISGPFR